MSHGNGDNFLSQYFRAIDMRETLIEYVLNNAIEIGADNIFACKFLDDNEEQCNIGGIDFHSEVGEDVIKIFGVQFADDEFDLFCVLFHIVVEVVVGEDGFEGVG